MTGRPRPKDLKGWCRLIFCGFCMGAADLVPGVSGGTMALVLGIYEPFIQSLCTLDKEALNHLFHIRWKPFFKKVAWQFLSALGLGMVAAIFTLAPFFHFLLNHALYKSYLFAFFLGLVLASSYYCGRKVQHRNLKTTSAFSLGALGAAIVTFAPFASFSTPDALLPLCAWMFVCGLLGVCAMLLPGISGSYVLTILKAYPIIIGALAALSSGLIQFTFPLKSFLIIFSLGLGIGLGALLFSRMIRFVLIQYHDITIACMVGFMLGALPAIWPFWHSFDSWETLIACGFALSGGLIVMAFEKVLQPSSDRPIMTSP